MKTRNLAVRAAALAAMVVAVAMVAPAHAAFRDYSWGSHLGEGRARQFAARRSAVTVAHKNRLSLAVLRPLRDWDVPGVLPAPVVMIIGDF